MTLVSKKLEKRISHFRDILLDISGIDPLAKQRTRNVIAARTILACALYDEGYSESAIASALHKNHSTVNYYRQRLFQFDLPGWEPENDLWKEFKKKI